MDAADILPKGITCPHSGKHSGFTNAAAPLGGSCASGGGCAH